VGERISCACGYDFRTIDESELSAVTEWHLIDEHPGSRADELLHGRTDDEAWRRAVAARFAR
jgi:hypothetical protein